MLDNQMLNLGHELILFICDALRFISAFIIPISRYAPHIYISALSFASEQSLVARKFCLRFSNTVVVTEGKPNQWPIVVFTAEHHKIFVHPVVFLSNEGIFASISTLVDKILCICDFKTGHCISGPFKLSYDEFVYDTCFSSDGTRILLKFCSYAVVLDIGISEEQFQIKGEDFVFIHYDGRIASTYWIKMREDGKLGFWSSYGMPAMVP